MSTSFDEQTDPRDEPWYPDFPGQPYMNRAFCDVYEVHDEHGYRAINHESYNCPGFTAQDRAELDAIEAEPPCEHGMSARDCGGPMHWYDPE